MDRICSLKDQFLSLVEGQMGDIRNVDAKEMGEVIDIIKDLAETYYYCKITEAMDKNDDGENMKYIDKYLPEAQKYYTRPRMYFEDKWKDDRFDSEYRNRMYYTEPHMNNNTNYGRSYISRRSYMEAMDKTSKDSELENYMADLSSDLTEMIKDMDANSRSTLKSKLVQLAGKIV